MSKDLTDVVTSDLRALLFWATVGVQNSRGGAYEKQIGEIIKSYSKHLKFTTPGVPKFKKSPFTGLLTGKIK